MFEFFAIIIDLFVSLVFDLGLPILIIYFIAKAVSKSKKKNLSNQDKDEEDKQEDLEQPIAPAEHKDYCDYCGAVVPKGKRKCPSCGAKTNIK